MADIFKDARYSSAANIRYFIQSNLGGDANYKNDDDVTVLHFAALYAGNVEVVKVLVSMGANVNICEENGLTPLDIAIGGGKVEIVKILLPYVSDINARDKNNLTLLHKAAISRKMAGDKNVEVAKLLISKGADINARAIKGTPLEMAKELGDTAMAKYLSDIAAEKEKIEIDKIFANYTNELNKNPNDTKIYEKRGFEFLINGFFDLAIKDYTQILKLNSEDGAAYQSRGMAYSQKAEAYRLSGIASPQIKEYDYAIEDFNHVLKLTPDAAEANRFRGLAYSQKHEYDKAIADFNDAIRLKPDQYIDHMSRGIAYRELRQNDQAKRDLEKTLELNPDNTTISIVKNMLKEINMEEQAQQEQECRIAQEKKDKEERELRAAKEREQNRIKTEQRKKRNKIIVGTVVALIIALTGYILYNSQQNSITIPDSVVIIKEGEFSSKQLVNVDIPDSVTTIKRGAFRKNKLTSVIIPASVTSIGDSAFVGNKITSIVIGGNVLLGSDAFGSGFESFYKKNGLSAGTYRISEPQSQEWRVWYNNFEYHYNNRNISIIGYNGSDRDLLIPDEISGYPVTIISKRAFYEKNFTSVIIPDSVINIEEMAFFGAWDRTRSVALGIISSLTIGQNVTTIGDRVFENNSLSSISIPNSVTSIGYSAFADNPITSIRIGANVKLGSVDSNGILGQNTGFNTAYANNNSRAGTYTRPNTSSTTWTRR